MKLISLNIEVNKHYDTVLPFLKREKADVVCIQELLESDFALFKKELNLEGVFRAFTYVNYKYPDKINGQKHGVAIFANNIIDSGYVFYFGKEDNLLRSFTEHLADEDLRKNSVLIWADIKDNDGKVFKFVNTHLPVTKEGESTLYQLQVVDALLKTLSSIPEFVICGDMNAPRGNESFRRLAKKYKDNIPLKYETSIDQKLHRVKGIMFMVDGIFTTDAYVASNVKLIDGVSDHMAIVADINKR